MAVNYAVGHLIAAARQRDDLRRAAQLIAGPIVHHREMMPQFTSGHLVVSCGRDPL